MILKKSHKITSAENINTSTQPNYNGRFATISRLDILPTSDDDYKTYTCQAKHPALPAEKSLKTSVQLSVLCKL